MLSRCSAVTDDHAGARIRDFTGCQLGQLFEQAGPLLAARCGRCWWTYDVAGRFELVHIADAERELDPLELLGQALAARNGAA